jgi:hypothetical protein
MKKLKPRTDLPKHIEQSLKDLYVRLGLHPLVTRLKQEVLSPKEIQLIDKVAFAENAYPIDVANAILGAVVHVREVSAERALIDLSRHLDLLGVGRYESLRRAIGEPIDDHHRDIPVWEADAGVLHFAGKVVRQVSPRATNIRLILNAFQEDKWPIRIDSPLPRRTDSRKLREAVRSLKHGLTGLDFICDGKGEGVQWQEAK